MSRSPPRAGSSCWLTRAPPDNGRAASMSRASGHELVARRAPIHDPHGSGAHKAWNVRVRATRVAILRPMSPLANATIATVGSGVMAEAMIAGLLRGALVDADRVIASHPRAERREALEREYGIRTAADNVAAVKDADVILLGIKPQMLNKVGREIGPHLRR